MIESNAYFRFSPRILDHLGISAYDNLKKCLGELASNGYDADARLVTITLPDTIEGTAVIVIEDDGTGMSEAEVRDKFLFIGRNRRKDGQRTPSGRLVIGSKGIGKLAGFGVASRMQLTTWKDGVQSVITIDRESLDDIRALSEHLFPIAISASEHHNGSKIRLFGLSEGLHLPSANVVRRYLYRTLPKQADFCIVLNDVECTAEDVLGERHDFSEIVNGIGHVTGFYVIANQRQPNPGLAVRVRDRVVKEPSLFGLDTREHGFFTAEKIIGEVNAEFLDPDDSSSTTRELINTTRDGLLEASEIVMKFNAWAHEFLKKVIQGVDATETKRRTDSLLNRPAIKERLNRMPAHVRGTATKVVKGVLSKLKNVTDTEAEELIEWILRYYESNILRELMRAIISSNVKDAEQLGKMIQDWGLKQLNSVVDIIQTQIEIIAKLEELIASDSAKEIDVHKLVENNLWLIQEGLELWSSDKPLKKVLDSHLETLYKNRSDLRPDLICRSRDEGTQAVIIEFKRPKEKVVMRHITQALEYDALLEKHRPNMKFTTYVIGRDYDPTVLAARDKTDVQLWSLEEILQRTRARFEKILEILGR